MPEMIRYYSMKTKFYSNVLTYLCMLGNSSHVYTMSQESDKLVVKAANESGGYGMLVGPHAS